MNSKSSISNLLLNDSRSTGERSKNRRQPVRMPRSKKPDSFYLNLDPESCFDLSSSIEGNAFTKAGNLQTIWSCDETTSSNNVEKTCRRTGFGFSPRLLKPPSREDWNQIIANDSFEVTQKSFNLSTGQIQVTSKLLFIRFQIWIHFVYPSAPQLKISFYSPRFNM